MLDTVRGMHSEPNLGVHIGPRFALNRSGQVRGPAARPPAPLPRLAEASADRQVVKRLGAFREHARCGH